MSRLITACALVLGTVFLAGCSPTNARVGVGTPPGLLVTYVHAPMGVPKGGPPRIILPPDVKTGTATFRGFYLKTPTVGVPGVDPISVGVGDGSWQKAMENGGLEEVYFADYREFKLLMGIYAEYQIILYGR